MDEIQKILIKAGRKDLAQKYYEKVADDIFPKIKEIVNSLSKDRIEEQIRKADLASDQFEKLLSETQQSGKHSGIYADLIKLQRNYIKVLRGQKPALSKDHAKRILQSLKDDFKYEKVAIKNFTQSTTKDLIELYELSENKNIIEEVLHAIHTRAKKGDPVALKFYKGVPGTGLKAAQNVAFDQESEAEAAKILKMMSMGYDSNKAYLRSIIQKIQRIKMKCSIETKQKLEQEIRHIKEVLSELNEN